jgi:hypothetical protein
MEHVFSVNDILNLAESSEKQCLEYLNKSDIVGAQVYKQSGYKLRNSYKYPRIINEITILRRSTGWFITDITNIRVYRNDYHKSVLHFTPRQSDLATNKFQSTYRVLKG